MRALLTAVLLFGGCGHLNPEYTVEGLNLHVWNNGTSVGHNEVYVHTLTILSAFKVILGVDHQEALDALRSADLRVEFFDHRIACPDGRDGECVGAYYPSGHRIRVHIFEEGCFAVNAYAHEMAHVMLDYLFEDPDAEHTRDEVWHGTTGVIPMSRWGYCKIMCGDLCFDPDRSYEEKEEFMTCLEPLVAEDWSILDGSQVEVDH